MLIMDYNEGPNIRTCVSGAYITLLCFTVYYNFYDIPQHIKSMLQLIYYNRT